MKALRAEESLFGSRGGMILSFDEVYAILQDNSIYFINWQDNKPPKSTKKRIPSAQDMRYQVDIYLIKKMPFL
jgi:hypothetical protein